MKKSKFLIAAMILLVLSTCELGAPFTVPTDEIENPENTTFIVFDNSLGISTVLAYNDPQRREEDKIAEIPAGQVSTAIEWTPGSSVPFYFSYIINLRGVNDFSLIYIPEAGYDQKSVRIDEDRTTNIIIPILDETITSSEQLLSSNSYLSLQNNSNFSVELYRGSSSIRPDNISTSSIVNSWEKALYTIESEQAVNYQLMVGINYKKFPDSFTNFEAGHFYSFIYNGGVILESGIPITLENIVAQKYTVTFDINNADGTTPAVQIVSPGSAILLPSEGDLTKNGYTFDGWNVNASGTGINYNAGNFYTVTSDIIFFARWLPVGTTTFIVNFDSTGGNNIPSQNIASGNLAFLPEAPNRNGYIFSGWYIDPEFKTEYDFSSQVTENITLYAKWNIIRYTVTFNTNGGNGTTPAVITADNASVITLPGGAGLSKPEHTFGGWNINASGTGINYSPNSSYTVTGNVTFYAKWDFAGVTSYTVTFNSNDGSAVSSQNVVSGNSVINPADPIRSGFNFGGWYSDPSLTNLYNFSVPVTGDIILYARWDEFVVANLTPGLYRGTVRIGNENLASSLSWISAHAVNGDEFFIVLGANETISPTTLGYSGKNVGITLMGSGGERTVSLSSNGSMFTVNAGVTLTLDINVTLLGRSANNAVLVMVNQGGTLLMNDGVTIRDNQNRRSGMFGDILSLGGGVYVYNGTFIMNGGIITNNGVSSSSSIDNSRVYSHGGGVYIANGVFTMNGGKISANTAISSGANSVAASSSGGGVFVGNGTFIMYGGKITGNSSSASTTVPIARTAGGGVAVQAGASFIMYNGIISGNSLLVSSYNIQFAYSIGGGVSSGGSFHMHGGVISGNTANQGGGVYGRLVKIPSDGSLNSGIIYGSDAVGRDEDKLLLQNGITEGWPNISHAVYSDYTYPNRNRNTTAWETDHFDTTTGMGLSESGEPPFEQ